MSRPKDARKMAAVLDKARELSRNETAADWSEAEWKELMAAAVAQRIERKPGHAEPGRKPISWKPSLAYGSAALVVMVLIGFTLKNTILKPAASPVPPSPIIAQKPVSPPLPAIEAPSSERPVVIARVPEIIAPTPDLTVIRPRKPARSAARPQEPAPPGEAPSQNVVTVKLVSPDTGLQIVWVLNKNFEWKGENP